MSQKAMRRRIALPKHFVRIYRRRLLPFAQAFGVRARPRVAFNSAPFRPPRHDLMVVALF
jgi:hypothetical protein